jgi:N-acyl homoserine lactone hydrolase
VKLAGQFNPPTYVDTRIDVFAYLVIAEDGVLLIDTGVGVGNETIDRRFEPVRRSLTDALAEHGVAPGEVRYVVNSHLHFDHCGNNGAFPAAEVLVQADELAVARALGDRYTVPCWFDHDAARIRAVQGDEEIGPGISLIASPGHTPGHQSVLVDLGDRRVLVAAQAAFTADEYRRGGDPKEQAHEGFEAAYVQSIARLKALAADETRFSHDAGVAVARA